MDKYSSIAKRISSGHLSRTAGKIEFIRDQGPVRRDIRVEGFEWSPHSLRNLAKILWAAQRSHSYANSAMRLLSKMPSSRFSPDGLLGGRGYIQSIKDLRNLLSQSAELLSAFTDTLYDEVNADHWNSVDKSKSNALVEGAQQIKSDPDQFVEQEYQQEGEKDFLALNPAEMNPTPQDYGQAEEQSSSADSGSAAIPRQSSSNVKESITDMAFQKAFRGMLNSHKTRLAGGNSSLPLETMSGPRIEHVGPGESPYGFFNGPDGVPSDDPTLEGFITDSPIYEDDVADGVSPYTNPTDGDISHFKLSSDSYSMLPGSDNRRLAPIYTPGISQEEIDFLVNSAKDPVQEQKDIYRRPSTKGLWGR